jgi:hypothetical protein
VVVRSSKRPLTTKIQQIVRDQQRSAHTTTVVRPYNLLPLPWLGARSCWNVPHSPTHPPRHPLSANIRTITNVFTAATVS